MSEHSKPIKHVFVPQPPTEQEQQAWGLAAANAQSVRIMHDELTASQQRVAELGIALREVSSAVGAGMGDGETVSNPDALAKAILEQVDTHIRISREAGRNEAQQRVAELEMQLNHEQFTSVVYLERCKVVDAENERLRGLLRECWNYLPLKGTTYNAMACQDSKLEDRIKAELAKGE